NAWLKPRDYIYYVELGRFEIKTFPLPVSAWNKPKHQILSILRNMRYSIEVPSEVKTSWSEVSIRIKDKKTNKTTTYKVKINSNFKIPGTNLLVKVGAFMPTFSHPSAEIITSSSNKPENPALQVSIYEHEVEKYQGWLFSKYPDMHAFEHPLISIQLEDKFETSEIIRAKEEAERGKNEREKAERERVRQEKVEKEKTEREARAREEIEREERKRREAPASLVTSLQFSDTSSCIPNNTLDAGEEGLLKVSVKNDGKGIGFEALINLSSSQKLIDMPETVRYCTRGNQSGGG
ncbi:MAG: DUF2155 domain-containing protein, partial [Candidatus Schekmanbacteria bacterium]|nr:DUF2155 domain-containing protein [Candidatus Schekmanbacteria bacterium]